ncbi:MAG: hypothetical protein JOZ41_02530 [Chloroflexi bacterium]|nr:hypothetical protein [Chloroflexota bacterium]
MRSPGRVERSSNRTVGSMLERWAAVTKRGDGPPTSSHADHAARSSTAATASARAVTGRKAATSGAASNDANGTSGTK